MNASADTVAVAASDLDRIATFTHGAMMNARLAQSLAIRAGSEEIRDAAEDAAEDAARAVARLHGLGARPSSLPKTKSRGDGLDLSALASLASLDTAAAQLLLESLRGVLPTAETVDRERGAWYENAPPTDTKGTDFAETIHYLICRLEIELTGPRSRGGE